MNERIKELAEQAGISEYRIEHAEKEFERFVELIRQDEREACAKLCESMMIDEYATGKVDHNERTWTDHCAEAIRARGEK
jgi:hypothetical protein